MTYQNSSNISGTCTQNAKTYTIGSYNGASAPSGAFSTPSLTHRNVCHSNYLFGYNNTSPDSTNYLQFSTITLGTLPNHWAINFQFKIVFIDEWPSTGAVYIQDASGNVYFSWIYNVYGATG
jgi:hypothetical protein